MEQFQPRSLRSALIDRYIRHRLIVCMAAALIIVASVVWVGPSWARTQSTNYIIFGDVIAGGGTEDSQSTNYGLADTIGEAITQSATSTATNYGIKAGFRELYADQFLTLSSSASSISLGSLTNLQAKTASHTLTLDTNAVNGYTVTVSGSTLVSGANTITAIGGTAVASSIGSEQFGINLTDNSSPDVGANPSGTGPIGAGAGQYAIANQFAFNSGDTVANATVDVSSTIFTVSYMANTSAATEFGTYTTTLTYAATANF